MAVDLKKAGGSSRRFEILDALRFILALWVVIGHLKLFNFAPLSATQGILFDLDRGLNTLIWGMPAVMAFFVISGFCIHYPNLSGRAISLRKFYMRRYTRILLPVLVAIALMCLCFNDIEFLGRNSILWKGTLWSLFCEEVYYAIYPLLRLARAKFGWIPVLVISCLVSFAISFTSIGAKDWFDIGPLQTAFLLLPIWILGCILSEQVSSIHWKVSTPRIWIARFGVWLSMWITEFLNFHTPLSQVHVAIFMGLATYLWLREEIARARTVVPPRWLIKSGDWSYSLYLVHPIIFGAFDLYFLSFRRETLLGWAGQLALALTGAYIFFLLIERPAHRLAKRLGSPARALPREVA